MSQRRHKTGVALILAIAIVLTVAAFLVSRRTDFSFVHGLSVRTLAYVVPLFIVYQSAAVLAHALLLRDMGYPTRLGRLTTALFASYLSNITSVSTVGARVGGDLRRDTRVVPVSVSGSATSVLYSVELAITSLIVLVGFSYLVPETAFHGAIWLGIGLTLIVVLSVLFHLSRRTEVRLPGLGRRLADFLAQLRDGMGRTAVTTLAAVIGLVLAKRVLLAFTSYLILRAIGNYLPVRELMFLQSSAILIGFASMIPLGLGTRDVTSFLLYMRLGLKPEVSAAMAAIERAIWTLVPVCLGLACTALNAVSNRMSGGSRRGS